MASNLGPNVSEAKRLIELIQGDNVQIKESMTSTVLNQIKILNDAVPDLLKGLNDLGKMAKVKDLDETHFVFIKKKDKATYQKQKWAL